MKRWYHPQRVADRLSRLLFRCVGIDEVTRVRIHRRNDLRTRLGTRDCGWIVPESLLGSNAICYCVGCGEDISFDLALIDRFGCDVFAFDPTPRAIQYVQSTAARNPKYHFSEIGLWDKADTLKFYAPKHDEHVSHSLVNLQSTETFLLVPVKRLRDIMHDLGHGRIDVLKLDIEGAEYRVIESIVEDQLDIKVLCVEFDECFHPLDTEYRQRIRAAVTSLLEIGYQLVDARKRGNYTFVRSA